MTRRPSRPAILLDEPLKRVLQELRIGGAVSRTQIASRLGIGNAALTRISRELIALGLVTEQSGDPVRLPAGRGRPTVPLALSGAGGYALGAAPHPGWIDIVAVDFAGRALVRDEVPFDSPDPRVFASTLERRLRGLVGHSALIGRRLLGLGIASVGYVVDPHGDRRWTVERIAGWREVAQATFFEDALGFPVWIENDGTTAALAEYYSPNVIGRFSNVLTFFLGHGLGGGVIADRRLVRGENGNAGEIGRLFLDPDQRPSGLDLMNLLRSEGVHIDSLAELDGLLEAHGEVLSDWTDRVSKQLRHAIESGAAWLDPGAVIVAGALPLSMLDDIARRLQGWNTPGYFGAAPSVFASELGSAAVATGAAMLPIHAITA